MADTSAEGSVLHPKCMAIAHCPNLLVVRSEIIGSGSIATNVACYLAQPQDQCLNWLRLRNDPSIFNTALENMVSTQ